MKLATLGMSIDMNSSFSFLSRSLNEYTEELSKSLDKRINSLSRSLNESYASIDTSLSIKIDQIEDKSVGIEDKSVETEDKSVEKLEKAKNKLETFARITNTIAGTTKTIAGAIDKVGQASDHYMAIQSRIEAINDGQQTVNELNDKIFASAGRTRTSYEDMVGIVDNLASNAGGAFSSNDEMLGFSELMVKSMKIAGASQNTQKDVMNKLTGAMEKGKLQGDAFNSILQNTPMLAQAMADKLGVSLKTLKDMGSQGKLSSGVLKSALFSSADDINSKFADVPITYGEIITRIKDMISKSLAPAFQKFNDLLNSDGAREFINNIANGIAFIAGLASMLIEGVIGIASLFLDNWSIIAPIILGIIAALVVYSVVMGIIPSIQIAVKAAQDALNTSLTACPIAWIIMAVILLIAVFYGVIAAINQFTGQSLSATGIIVGAFMVALAFIGNLFITAYNLIIDVFCIIWNIIISFVEFFANVFNDPIGSIIRLFANMGDAVLGIIEAIASGIDTLFGTNFAEGVSGWRDDLKGMTDKLVEKQEIEIERLDPNEEHIDRLEYEKAFDYGNDIGKGIDNAVGGIFNKDIFEKDNPIDKFDQGGFDKDNMNINSVNQVNNVGSVDDTVDVSSEDLKVMRELAEIKAVENFVTLTPSVQVQTGDIKNDVDVNKVVKKIGDLLKDDIATSTKEVYALG